MKMSPTSRFRRILRFVLVFLIIYTIWSACVDICGLDHNIDNESIIPCLFCLPPLGILGIGIVLLKIIESVVFVRFVKRIRKWFRKKFV
jgi:hypothetical protein